MENNTRTTNAKRQPIIVILFRAENEFGNKPITNKYTNEDGNYRNQNIKHNIEKMSFQN